MGAVGYLFLMKISNAGANQGYWLPFSDVKPQMWTPIRAIGYLFLM
jgi:hypothetical protein